MDKNTLQYALDMLDLHRHYSVTTEKTPEQEAYYKGLYDMLEIILTEAHHLPVFITLNKKGCHKKVQRVS